MPTIFSTPQVTRRYHEVEQPLSYSHVRGLSDASSTKLSHTDHISVPNGYAERAMVIHPLRLIL